MYIVSRQKRVIAATETPILDIVPGLGNGLKKIKTAYFMTLSQKVGGPKTETKSRKKN